MVGSFARIILTSRISSDARAAPRRKCAPRFVSRARRISSVVRAAFRQSCANRVDLVDEEHDLARRLGHLLQHRLETLLELTPATRARA
eukprot:2237305-Pleurochrysis_carterae.AAC.1